VEIWQTLKAALEVLWAGGDSQEGDGGLGTAQLILDAVDVTVPTGDLANGVYDGLGAFYQLPDWIVADPTNLGRSSNEGAMGKDGDGDKGRSEEGEVDEEELLRRREEKGKAVVNARDMVSVKARLSDGGGPDLVVSVGRADSVRLLIRRIFEESGLPSTKSIRIAYMGKILKESQSPIAQGWKEGHVVNALIFG
jgi:hypothetical protein